MRCYTDWCPFPDETDVNDCEWCDGCNFYKAPPTNAEQIRAMSDEELAKLFSRFCHNAEGCKYCPMWDDCPEADGLRAWESWLKQPAK